MEALTTLRQELCDVRGALCAKASVNAARLDEVERRIERIKDAELAKERAVQLEKDGYLMAFEDPHERFIEHLTALMPGIVTHVAHLHVTIDGWHLTGSEGVDEDSREMDVGSLRMSGAQIPKAIRGLVNAQTLLEFIEQRDALLDLNQSTLMQELIYTDNDDSGYHTGKWTGDVPVYVVMKPALAREAAATSNGGAKRAKKQK